MKKPLLSLLISFLFIPAAPVLAEDIHYDGTNSGMLGTDPVFGNTASLFPNAFTGNTVTVDASGETIGGFVFGGVNAGSDDVGGNTVVLKDGVVNQSVFGGFSRHGETANNAVTIAGGTVMGGVNGGVTEDGTANSNSVVMTGGYIMGNLQGGEGYVAGTANGNIVSMTGGTVAGSMSGGNVAGGRSKNGSATGNTVNLSGGTISGNVTGGVKRVDTESETRLSGRAPGISTFAGGDFFTGNTLNASNRFSLAGLGNFQFFNFTLPAGFQAGNGDALISASNVEFGGTSTVNSINSAQGGNAFSVGETITLISSATPFTNSSLAANTAQGIKGFALLYNWDINLEPTALTATLSGVTVNPQSHALLAGRASELALLKQGGDLLASQALENMVASAKPAIKDFSPCRAGTADMNPVQVSVSTVLLSWLVRHGVQS